MGSLYTSKARRLIYASLLCSPVSAREKKEATTEPGDTFSWKDVLRDILRLRQDDKLSEGNVNAIHASSLLCLKLFHVAICIIYELPSPNAWDTKSAVRSLKQNLVVHGRHF